mmetsp:Transcript_96808/g.278514  ORF Transcript_96808/g.278514 Transcript_96808/m.278514 type:complete len:241 (-) Transcript_96808:47-769(-)
MPSKLPVMADIMKSRTSSLLPVPMSISALNDTVLTHPFVSLDRILTRRMFIVPSSSTSIGSAFAKAITTALPKASLARTVIFPLAMHLQPTSKSSLASTAWLYSMTSGSHAMKPSARPGRFLPRPTLIRSSSSSGARTSSVVPSFTVKVPSSASDNVSALTVSHNEPTRTSDNLTLLLPLAAARLPRARRLERGCRAEGLLFEPVDAIVKRLTTAIADKFWRLELIGKHAYRASASSHWR